MKNETAGGELPVPGLAESIASRQLQSRHALDDTRTQRVIDYMTAHLEDSIDLDDLAAAACLSPFHFARLFRNRMGVPPYRFLSTMRLERAKMLLMNTSVQLSEIALVCQFSNQTNFTRAFRQFAGVTPNVFRKKRACAAGLVIAARQRRSGRPHDGYSTSDPQSQFLPERAQEEKEGTYRWRPDR
jgi:AraC-like DNA-binding protein